MVTVNVAELKSRLSHYLKQKESIVVTSHGAVIARIVPEHKEPPIVNWLEFFEKNPPVHLLKKDISTSELIRQMRDEEL